MRLLLLCSFIFFYASANAQVFLSQFNPINFSHYPNISDSARLEYDDFGNAYLVEGTEAGFYNLYYRKAQAKQINGKWLVHGVDSIRFDGKLFHTYTVQNGIAQGPFQLYYWGNHMDLRLPTLLTGKYKNGKLDGKVQNNIGGYFYCEDGIPDGKYKWLYRAYDDISSFEEGRFKKGKRHGEVRVKEGKQVLFNLNYSNGFLISGQLSEESWEFACYIQGEHDPGSRIYKYYLMDEARDTFRTITLFGVDEINQIQFNRYFRYIKGGKANYILGDADSSCIAEQTYNASGEKLIFWHYSDGKTSDTTYYLNNPAWKFVIGSKSGDIFYFDSAGTLESVSLNYRIKHDIKTCLYGIVDVQDSIILPVQFDMIYWSDQVGFITKKDGLLGVYSWEGRELLSPSLDNLKVLYDYYDPENPENSYANAIELRVNTSRIGGRVDEKFELIAQKGKYWGIINQDGKWVLPCEHEHLTKQGPFTVSKEGKQSSLWCKKEDFYQKCLPAFNSISLINQHLIIQDTAGLWGVLNMDLTWLLKPKYKSISCTKHFNYIELDTKSPNKVIITDTEFRPIFKDTLNAYPEYDRKYIKLVRYDKGQKLHGIASYTGKIWLKADYSLLYPALSAQHRTTFNSSLFRYQSNTLPIKEYVCDTLGHYLGPFDELSILWSSALWSTVPNEKALHQYTAPKTQLLLVRNQDKWDLLDIQGNSHIPSGIKKEDIDDMWATNTLLHIQCGDSLRLYYIPNQRLIPVDWNNKKIAQYELGFQLTGNYVIFKNKIGMFGLMHTKSGMIVRKPIYHSIIATDNEFVLHEMNGKQSHYVPNGLDSKWNEYTCRFRTENAYAVAGRSGKMGFTDLGGQLVIDTIFDKVYTQKFGYEEWYYGIRGDSIYSHFSRFEPILAPQKGMLFARMSLYYSLLSVKGRSGKMLIHHADSSGVWVDNIINLNSLSSQLYYTRQGLYGAANGITRYNVETKYNRLWERFPNIAYRNDKWAILDSTGAEKGLYSQSEFCRQNLTYLTYQYSRYYNQSGISESKHTFYKPSDQFTWADNLILLLNLESTDVSSIPTTIHYIQSLKQYSPDATSNSVNYFFYGNRDPNTTLFTFPVHIPLKNNELLSAIRPMSSHSKMPLNYLFRTYWMSPDSVLKELSISDFIQDEAVLTSKLTQEFIRLNFQIDECPDLAMLYPLFKKNFYLKEEGLCFAIKLSKYPNSHNYQYGEVLLKWEDLKSILKDQAYLKSLLSK